MKLVSNVQFKNTALSIKIELLYSFFFHKYFRLDILHPLRTAAVSDINGESKLSIKFGDYNNTDDFVRAAIILRSSAYLPIPQALDVVNRELFPENMPG